MRTNPYRLFLSAVLLVSATTILKAGPMDANTVWNDGLVEKAVYASERIIYNKKRPYEELILTNTQTIDMVSLVKASNETPDLLKKKIFKMNRVAEIPTDYYDYRYLTTVFVDYKNLLPIKMTIGSQEWCGNTYRKFFRKGRNSYFEVFGYFPGENYEKTKLKYPENGIVHEQLPVYLRNIDYHKNKHIALNILNPQLSNRIIKPAWEETELTVLNKEEIKTKIGSINCWKLKLAHSRGEDYYWIETSSPNMMIKHVTHDKLTSILISRERLKFWK